MDSTSKNVRILGHEKIEKELVHAIVSGKIFPTWIFSGPFGVGKTSMAVKFAKCLLAGIVPQKEVLDIPEDSRIHNLVDLRIHPDFFILEQSNESISIDDTRVLMQKIRKTPTQSQWRVVIIENASDFNKNIYNSMLKILEEPPKNTVIIMICQNTGNIPRTLLSRACHLRFNPLNDKLVERILTEKRIPDAKRLSEIANGSVGYAMFLQEHNGIEFFDLLSKIFLSGNKKALQYAIENDLTNNFRIIKESLLYIFRMRAEEILVEERMCSADNALKDMIEIISVLNKSDSLALDKTAFLSYAYETIFNY